MNAKKNVGSVSSGTLRVQDLVPVFLDELESRDKKRFDRIIKENSLVIPDDGTHHWWDSEEAGYLLIDLMDALEETAPKGYYFGPHPGDGADYGFWKISE